MNFSDAIHVYFPQWDAGSVYTNVLGCMIYPRNEEKRKSFVARSLLEQKIISKNEYSEEYHSEDYANDFASLCKYFNDPQKIHSTLFGAQTNTTINEFAKKLPRGFLTGQLLYIAHLNKTSIQKAFDFLTKGKDEYFCIITGRKEKILCKNFCDKVWKDFSPVAHYWASWVFFFLCRENWESPPSGKYPDRHFFSVERFRDGKPNGFKGFLLVADSFLKWGTIFVPPTSTHRLPLMKMSECYYVCHPFYEGNYKI